MARTAITKAKVDKLRGGNRRRVFYDEKLPGFGVRVEPSGRRTYFVEYRAGRGRRYPKKRFTIASHGVMTAEQARAEAAKILARVRLGEDPQAVRRAAASRTSQTSFETIAGRYIELVAKPSHKRWQETDRLLRVEAFPALGRRDITEIRRGEVAALVDAIAARGAPHAARRFLEALRPVFAFARDRGYLELNPVADLKPTTPPARRDRVLSQGELAAVVQEARTLPPPWSQAILALLLTGARRGEIAGMEWSEVSDDGKTWNLPGARSKNGRPHAVPLAHAVRRLLASLPRTSPYVFAGRGRRPIGGWSKVKTALDKKLGEKVAAWTWHDLRRTATTMMADHLAVPPHIVEAVLNHVSGSKAGVAGTYNRAVYAEEKRRALRRWAVFVLRRLR